jgi:hypothetical protein
MFSAFCRYHYDISNSRLHQCIEEGNEAGLLISCVASVTNLWTLVMDAGTGFSSQVYEVSQFFVHKVGYCLCLLKFAFY